MLEAGIEVDVLLVGEQGIDQADLRGGEAERFVFSGREAGKPAVLAEPFFGKDAEGAVIETDRVVAAGECRKQFGEGSGLAVEVDFGGQAEPVDS